MAIIDKKRKVFGSISAMNVLNEGLPDLSKYKALIPSINNGTSTEDFLIELVQQLVGFDALKEKVVDIITYDLDDIEQTIKDAFKAELKEMVSCNINPSIPTWLQQGGSGVTVTVPNIDFYDMMRVDPTTLEGLTTYTDVGPQKNSKDFNTYLHYTIQDPATPSQWGSSMTGTDILETVFFEQGVNDNNVLIFTTSSEYSSKKLTQFNNDFIDSMTIFGEPNSISSTTLINAIMEEMFSTISSLLNKSKKQFELEVRFNEVLGDIINNECDDIDDSFFEFDNPTLARMEEDAINKKKGIRILKTCGNLAVKVDPSTVYENQADTSSATTKQEEGQAVKRSLERVAEAQASETEPVNKDTARQNFFLELIKKFTIILMRLIFSPKFITILAINQQIIYGGDTDYSDPIDFIKKNRTLVRNISKKVRNEILEKLLELALKELTVRLKEKYAGDQREKGRNYVISLLSYLSVPPFVLAQIRSKI